MQYLLLCCFDETRWNAIPAAERDSIMGAYGEFVRRQIAGGRYVTGGKLDDSSAAVTLRQRDGGPSITDGPFAETKEQLGGYHVVECENREEALAIAGQIPTLPHGGTIEVRPLLYALV